MYCAFKESKKYLLTKSRSFNHREIKRNSEYNDRICYAPGAKEEYISHAGDSASSLCGQSVELGSQKQFVNLVPDLIQQLVPL